MGKLDKFLGSNVGELAVGGLAQGLSMLGEGNRYRRNMQGQMDLMNMQQANQMDLNKQGHELQMEAWNKTNYPAQVEMMRKAGLNPALMYGQAGSGGTTGGQGGGSATGGSAPNQYQPMDMSNMLMMAQARKLNAESDNIEKGTELIGENIKEVIANTNNKKLEYNLKQIEQWEAELEYEYNKETFTKRIDQIGETLRELRQKNDLTRDMYDNLVIEQFGKAMTAVNNGELAKAKTKLTEKELGVFEKVFEMKVKELEIAEGKLTIENRNSWTKELEIQIKKELGEKDLNVKKWNIAMRSFDNVVNGLFGIFNSKTKEEYGYNYEYEPE